MCLSPLSIRNPTHKINLQGGQPLTLQVPCGQCAECKKNKRLEWHFRTYHETIETIGKGGYVYFDTLTYSNKHVPHISHLVDTSSLNVSDFMCFCYSHWRNFLKNLRSYLSYHYKGVKFTYFLTSEYGTDERYTHRPHYHILFFINSKKIHPFRFSKLVSKHWPYGRTDGVRYKPRTHVASHVYGYELGYKSKVKNPVLCVSSYIAKYVTKDSTYQNEINKRLDILKSTLDSEKYKKIKSEISQYHRQSQGFGLSYIHNLDRDEYNYIYNTGTCRLHDKDKVTLTITLPLYYKRKLFYKCLKDDENKLFWQPNQQGLSYISKHYIKNIKKVKDHYFELFINATEHQKSTINLLLQGRTLTDFTIYMLFYKGRIRNYDSLNYFNLVQSTTLSDKELNLHDWLNSLSSALFYRTTNDNTLIRTDDNNVITYTDVGTLFDNPNTKLMSYESFIKLSTFNENSCAEFKHFDKLDSLFKQLAKPLNKTKQSTFDFIEELQSKFKVLYNNG